MQGSPPVEGDEISQALAEIHRFALARLRPVVNSTPAVAVFLISKPGTVRHKTNIKKPLLGRILSQIIAGWELKRIANRK